eukprot:s2596_g10.t1
MKAVRKRAKGAGNLNPAKRKSFPDVDQTMLEDKLDNYVRQMGKEQAFNMLEYTHLLGVVRLHGSRYRFDRFLLECLLQASPSAQVKYSALKTGLATTMHKWGQEILSLHFKCEKDLLPGRGADSLTASIMAGLRKRMAGSEETNKGMHAKRRVLKKEESEVTMASDGFPAMLLTQSDTEDGESAAESSAKSGAAESAPADSSCADLQKSPPPVLKSNWRIAAGKKPAAKKSLAKGQKGESSLAGPRKHMLKKPAAKSKKSSKDGARGGPDAIHLPSVKLGGGKAQSYIQHMPDGPAGSKRLIAACTAARAKFLKVTHKALMEELLPKCKKSMPKALRGTAVCQTCLVKGFCFAIKKALQRAGSCKVSAYFKLLQGSRWQKKEEKEDTQEIDDWETGWPEWPTQSWEQQGWEAQWHGKDDGWWERKEDEWWGKEKKTWSWDDWSDEWSDWSGNGQDAWSDDTQPQGRQGTQPQRRHQKEGAPGSSRTSGSYLQKMRLQKLKELQPPKNEEEEQALKYAAIGRARFQRMQGRQQKAMAAKLQEQQAALDRQQHEMQQMQQHLYQQQWQQWQQWQHQQWQQPQMSWVQGGYLIHPGLT